MQVMNNVKFPDGIRVITTHFGLDNAGLKRRWGGEILRTRPDRPWGSPSFLYDGYRVPLPGVKWPVRDVNHQL